MEKVGVGVEKLPINSKGTVDCERHPYIGATNAWIAVHAKHFPESAAAHTHAQSTRKNDGHVELGSGSGTAPSPTENPASRSSRRMSSG